MSPETLVIEGNRNRKKDGLSNSFSEKGGFEDDGCRDIAYNNRQLLSEFCNIIVDSSNIS